MADFIVTTLDDELDPADTVPATADPDDLSLREALALANGDPTTADTIRFDDSLAGGTLTLAHGELIVSGYLTIDGDIDGDGTPDITVDADSAWRAFEFPPVLDTSRVFNVTSGISTLNGLVITGGFARAGDGGGVRVGEGADVTISQSVVAGSIADADGGGIAVGAGGSLRLINATVADNWGRNAGGGLAIVGTAAVTSSTISGNLGDVGGGIANQGTLTLSNSTLANNQSIPVPVPTTGIAAIGASAIGDLPFAGGGLYNSGTATLSNSTVTGNYAFYGGGIFTGPFGGGSPSQLTLNNTIVAGNTAFARPDLYVAAAAEAVIYQGVSVFSQAGLGRSGIDIVEPDIANIFAAIDPVNGGGLLADNSGPVQTVAILVGGVAHNAGDNASLADDTEDLDGDTDTGEDLPFDVRGRDRVFDGTVDIGAFEFNDGPPTGNTAGGSILYIENQVPTALDPSLTVSDPTGFLSSARIAITGNFAAGEDVLGFTARNGIVAAYNAATGVLTLTGVATDVQYQDALRSVTYFNTSQNPSDAPRTVTFEVDDGGGPVDLGDVGVTVIPVIDPPHDFNADLHSDVLWRNDVGTVALWEMDGTAVISNTAIGTLPHDWFIVDVDSDFNGDGASDILWRDDTGTVVLWEMDGANIIANSALTGTSEFGAIADYWHIEDTGDFTGDGRADILWRDDAGVLVLWEMNGATIVANTVIGTVATTARIEDAADFSGDGMHDILWRDPDGTVRLWEMDGATMVADTVVAVLPDHWRFAGTGDFNADFRSDILWRDDTGTVVLWQMDGPAITTNTTLGTLPDYWQIADIGDYTGDSSSDILWRDDAGTIVLWEMDGPVVIDDSAINTIPTNWQIV